MYKQVLPAIRPRRLHRHRIDNILDLRAHARLNDLRQFFGLRDALEIECADERGKRRQPARKWRRRGRWGRVSRGRLQGRLSAATVGVTDDENCGARDGFSEKVCKRDGGCWGGNAKRKRERRTVFDADMLDGICYYREYVVIVWMDLAISVYMRVKTLEM